MTATTPRRRGPSTPVGGPHRTCHLYRFWVRHPNTGERVLGYIGETGRQPFRRLMEHIETQPWSDTILGWEVNPTPYRGKDAVLAAEADAIRAERPLFNIELNRDNPLRIPPWVAQRQRAERDRTHGATPWAPTSHPTARRTPDRQVTTSPVTVRVLTSRWTWWAVAYLAAAAGVWSLLGWVDTQAPFVALSSPLRLCLAAGLPVTYGLYGRWWWRNRGRRRWRRMWR